MVMGTVNLDEIEPVGIDKRGKITKVMDHPRDGRPVVPLQDVIETEPGDRVKMIPSDIGVNAPVCFIGRGTICKGDGMPPGSEDLHEVQYGFYRTSPLPVAVQV